MKFLLQVLTSLLLLTLTTDNLAQVTMLSGELNWKGVVRDEYPNGQYNTYIYFDNALIDQGSGLPKVSEKIAGYKALFEAKFLDTEFIECLPEESEILKQTPNIGSEVMFSPDYHTYRGNSSTFVTFLPFRLNPESGSYEKLLHYSLEIIGLSEYKTSSVSLKRNYADNSVLSQGEWYKFKVGETGIYKITYSDLVEAGLDVATTDPRKIKMYGNAGYMLPEANNQPRPDDLMENAIFVEGEEDGTFDPEDYILFYGLNPHRIYNVLGFMSFDMHLYDDYNYYYLTIGEEDGTRIGSEPSVIIPPTHIVNKLNDYSFFEEDNISLIQSGKRWFAHEFGEVLTKTYTFHFPDIVDNQPAVIKFAVANRTFANDYMVVNVNDILYDTTTLTSISVNSTKFAHYRKKTLVVPNPGNEINVTVTYQPASPTSNLWLDNIHVNAHSELILAGGQRTFRNLESVAEGAVSAFYISNTTASAAVWDVTDYIAPVVMETEHSGDQTTFTCQTEELREFIIFDGSFYHKPEFTGMVPNQNLHGVAPVDYVIVAHPFFIEEAKRLKQMHENVNNFDVLLTTPGEIFNEFSSGKQDPTAIRDLMKMMYDRSEGEKPRFLLLFGNGSFDPKDRIEHNTNFIVTFQTEESLMTASSFVVDDYFGMLDDNEGNDAIGYLDIGIGRFPVKTTEEAKTIVDKVYTYMEPGEPQYGKWRTEICIIADDEDGNLHLMQADSLASTYGYIPQTYNLNKIYLDAFQQIKTPSGDRYPEVNEKIKEHVERGALIVNYIGHGGIGGWAHERILVQNDIIKWTNRFKLPVFITATCEFSRFDEPEVTSGGELVILNPNGGGIALFTTTRLAYAQANFRLNERVYVHAFPIDRDNMPFLGEIIRESKPPGQWSTRNFVLLGDPGIRMAYPKYRVNTITINGKPAHGVKPDTLMALQKVEITGEITDAMNNLLSDFNGYICPVLYDKPTVYQTFGHDAGSFPTQFVNQDKIIWQGISTVENGKFSFSLVVPKDVSQSLGKGKFSYYAYSDQHDAIGYYDRFLIGGSDNNTSDDQGPDIALYLNDLSFVSGDQTHENPLLIAFLHDESGINLADGGIGRNITCILNMDNSNIIVLNDYFNPDTNSYRGGTINYQFNNLPDGYHSLRLKAWDGFNNSSEASIDFIIDKSGKLSITDVINYPNPFREKTTFAFRHTKPGENILIELEIYNITGQQVISYLTEIASTNTFTPFYDWSGIDHKGAQVDKGVYIYVVTVTDESGQSVRQHQKLIVN